MRYLDEHSESFSLLKPFITHRYARIRPFIINRPGQQRLGMKMNHGKCSNTKVYTRSSIKSPHKYVTWMVNEKGASNNNNNVKQFVKPFLSSTLVGFQRKYMQKIFKIPWVTLTLASSQLLGIKLSPKVLQVKQGLWMGAWSCQLLSILCSYWGHWRLQFVGQI